MFESEHATRLISSVLRIVRKGVLRHYSRLSLWMAQFGRQDPILGLGFDPGDRHA